MPSASNPPRLPQDRRRGDPRGPHGRRPRADPCRGRSEDQAEGRHRHPPLDGRRDGRIPRPSTRSGTRPFARRLKASDVCMHVPVDRHGRRRHQVHRGARERSARVMDRGTLDPVARRWADLGSILHSRHQYHWHTGYEPPQTVAAPHIGAWIGQALGPQEPGGPGVYRHRPALRGERRGRGAEGVPDRRLPRQRVRPVPRPRPARRRRRGPASRGHDA